jgi:hypothetical protein
MRLFALTTALLLIHAIPLFGAGKSKGKSGSTDDAAELAKTLNAVDKLWVGEASEAVLAMEVKTVNYTRNLDLKYWVKGKKNTLVLITGPKKEKGTATLKIVDDMYNYLPKTASTIKVSAALRGGSWMGSHFTNDDLIRATLLEDSYNSKILRKAKDKGDDIWHIELMPKAKTVTPWGKILLELNKTKTLPRKQEYFDEDQKLVRTVTYSEVKKLGDRTLPTIIKAVPKSPKGEFTKLVYKSIDYGVKLDDGFFSLTRLKDL